MKQLSQLFPQELKNYYHLLQALIASQLYLTPSKKLKIIGVTGTDGKTTTTNLIYHLLKESGHKVSMISTINAVIGNKEYDTGFHVTTPSPNSIQKYLSDMAKAGSEYAVLEVTSHALDQKRVFGLHFLAGVLTNITHEHLDYHKTYDNYLRAKAKLFKNVAYSILNRDDRSYNLMKNFVSGNVLTYGTNKDALVSAQNMELNVNGTEFDYIYQGQKTHVQSSLVGEFNVENILAAVTLVKTLGVSDEAIAAGLKTFKSVAGRMESVETKTDYNVIIDFAHTPNALENVLTTVGKLTRGKVIVVFGAAAQRDIAKRPIMGKIASKLADYVILTNEDPRFENPNQILTDIAKGVVKSGGVLNKTFWMIEERDKAIQYACSLAKNKDSVLILGKGHEKSISIRGKEYPWSDKEAVLKAVKQL